MFVQLNPDVESYSETISTLKFAERVSGVELGAARSNKEGRGVRDLMEQVMIMCLVAGNFKPYIKCSCYVLTSFCCWIFGVVFFLVCQIVVLILLNLLHPILFCLNIILKL